VALGHAAANPARRPRRLIVVALCLAVLAASKVHAGVPPPEQDNPVKVGLILAAIILLPSDVGVFLPGWGPDLALGWSYQIPFTPNHRHRFMLGLDLIPTSDSDRWRMRGGYRYLYGSVFAGLTAAYAREKDERSDPTWSPELGVRVGDNGAFAHLLARAEIPMSFDGFRGVALLLGWDMK
jgi:hypothetical protein